MRRLALFHDDTHEETLLDSIFSLIQKIWYQEARCTYSHTVHLLQKMEQEGLVRFEKNGRLKIVQLTGKGERVATSFESLGKILM